MTQLVKSSLDDFFSRAQLQKPDKVTVKARVGLGTEPGRGEVLKKLSLEVLLVTELPPATIREARLAIMRSLQANGYRADYGQESAASANDPRPLAELTVGLDPTASRAGRPTWKQYGALISLAACALIFLCLALYLLTMPFRRVAPQAAAKSRPRGREDELPPPPVDDVTGGLAPEIRTPRPAAKPDKLPEISPALAKAVAAAKTLSAPPVGQAAAARTGAPTKSTATPPAPSRLPPELAEPRRAGAGQASPSPSPSSAPSRLPPALAEPRPAGAGQASPAPSRLPPDLVKPRPRNAGQVLTSPARPSGSLPVPAESHLPEAPSAKLDAAAAPGLASLRKVIAERAAMKPAGASNTTAPQSTPGVAPKRQTLRTGQPAGPADSGLSQRPAAVPAAAASTRTATADSVAPKRPTAMVDSAAPTRTATADGAAPKRPAASSAAPSSAAAGLTLPRAGQPAAAAGGPTKPVDGARLSQATPAALQQAFSRLPFEQALAVLSRLDGPARQTVLSKLELQDPVRARLERELALIPSGAKVD